MSDFGKSARLGRVLGADRPILISPFDDSLISGPANNLTAAKFAAILRAAPDAVLTFPGRVHRYPEAQRVPIIANLTGSVVGPSYTDKRLVGTLEQALSVDAAAVAVHVNLFSAHASAMLAVLGETVARADTLGVPVMGILYPRGETAEGAAEDYTELRTSDPQRYGAMVAHCVHVGVDMGCAIVKTQWVPDDVLFQGVIDAGCGIPIVVAGGPLIPEEEALRNAMRAIRAGAAGTSYARNVFGRQAPEAFMAKLRGCMSGARS